MSALAVLAGDGEVVTVPIEQMSASVAIAREVLSNVDLDIILDQLKGHLERWTRRGWTVYKEPSIVMEDDFLANRMKLTMTVQMYLGPDPWSELDDQVDRDLRGGWRARL